MVIGSESIPGIRGIFQKLGIPKIGKKKQMLVFKFRFCCGMDKQLNT